jgi:hypothetical protein
MTATRTHSFSLLLRGADVLSDERGHALDFIAIPQDQLAPAHDRATERFAS